MERKENERKEMRRMKLLEFAIEDEKELLVQLQLQLRLQQKLALFLIKMYFF